MSPIADGRMMIRAALRRSPCATRRAVSPSCPARLASPARRSVIFEGIEHSDTGAFEVRAIASHDDEAVPEGGRRNEAVLDGHGSTRLLQSRQQLRPFQPRVGLPWKAMETLSSGVEPTFERHPLLSLRQEEDAESQLAEDDRIDGNVALVHSQPRHDTRFRGRLRRG